MLLPCTPLFSFFTLLSLSRKLSVDADQILKSCSFGTPSPFVAGAPLGLAPLAHQCLPYPFPRTLLRSPEKPGSGPPSVSWPAPYVCYLVKFRGSVVRCSRVFNFNVGQEWPMCAFLHMLSAAQQDRMVDTPACLPKSSRDTPIYLYLYPRYLLSIFNIVRT
jgi:hypothetical protein